MKELTKNTLNKFLQGEELTDTELKQLHTFFNTMEKGCILLGDEYNLFKFQMRYDKECVERFIESRKH